MIGRVALWLGIAASVGVMCHWPTYRPLPSGHAQLTVSVAHLTARLEPCRQLSPDELATLPPNMRAVEVCERPRAPAVIEVLVGDRRILATDVRPAGLHRDGRAYLVQSWALPAGVHRFTLRIRDTPRTEGFDMEESFSVELAAGAAVVLQVGDGDIRVLNSFRSGS